MPSFLNQVARQILTRKNQNLSDILVVLPTKRAGLFLKKALAEENQSALLAPHVFTPDELVSMFSGFTALNNRQLLFEFYEVYLSSEKEKADSFDRFLKWAPQLLSDFNDIDRYLLHPDDVFRDLRNMKELDMSFAVDNLSTMQQRFLEFWGKLGVWYHALNTHLSQKGMVSSGMAYRKAAEKVDEKLSSISFFHIYIAGFNALSQSENVIFKTIANSDKGTIIWDYDNYYTTDNSIHEAGYFHRQNRERIPNSVFIKGDNFNRIEQINLIPCPGSTSQTLELSRLLSTKGEIDEKTAIVLADEKLLPSFLNALPQNVTRLNITMGYKLKQTATFNLIKILLDIQKKNERQQRNTTLVYHKDLISLLQHPLVSPALKKLDSGFDVRHILRRLAERNRVYVGVGFLTQQFNKTAFEFLMLLLHPFETAKTYLDQLKDILNQLLDVNKSTEGNSTFSVLEKAAIYKLISIVNTLITQVGNITFTLNAQGFWRLLLTDIAKEKIDLYGEPFGGIQVMGVLETRALDFEKIYVLSVNEDMLPGQNREVSFLPFEVKKFHNLPTYKERDAVYAYHFYRLLQRSREASLFTAQVENGEVKEQSRFLTQLEYEFPRLKKINPPRVFDAKKKETVEIESEILIENLTRLAQAGISPSAINKWLSCPLDFMFQYVLGLRENEDEVQETMEYSTFGSLIHSTLEYFYKDFIGKELRPEILLDRKKLIPDLVKQAMLDAFDKDDIDKGLNYLNRKVIEKMCFKYIDFDCKELKNNGTTTLLNLEERLTAHFPFEMAGVNQICLKGFADRVEINRNTVKILDYKTGKLEENKLILKVEDFDDIESLAKKDKALQLLFYAVVYSRCHPENEFKISSGIIPVKYLGKGVNFLTFDGKTVLDKEDLMLAETLLLKLILKIFHPAQRFTHNENAKYCQYCG